MNILVAVAAASMAAKRSAYSLAREVLGLRAELAAARATASKVAALEEKVRRLRRANEFRKDVLRIERAAVDTAERDRDDARALIEKITGKPFSLREALEAGEEARERNGSQGD